MSYLNSGMNKYLQTFLQSYIDNCQMLTELSTFATQKPTVHFSLFNHFTTLTLIKMYKTYL